MEKGEEKLVLQFIPALIVILKAEEDRKKSPLTEEEVLKIRDSAICMSMPVSAAINLEKSRGYADIAPENCWNEWCKIRTEL
jgi:hypothetical protein